MYTQILQIYKNTQIFAHVLLGFSKPCDPDGFLRCLMTEVLS